MSAPARESAPESASSALPLRSKQAREAPAIWRLAFIIITANWLLVPFVLQGSLHQDLVPYLVAGDLLDEDLAAVYHPPTRGLADVDPLVRKRSCALLGPGAPCDQVVVPAVSPPVVLPIARVLVAMPQDRAALLTRSFGAIAFVVSAWIIWGWLAARSLRAPMLLTFMAAALTPFVVVSLALGQTSPLLLLVAVLAPARGRPWWQCIVAGVVWAVAVAFKVVPAVLVVVAIRQRAWRMLVSVGVAGLLLLVATLALAPADVFVWYLEASAATARAVLDVDSNLSLHATASWLGLDASSRLVSFALSSVVLGAAAVAWWRVVRHHDANLQWTFALLAVTFAAPLLWWHYAGVALAALAAALHSRHLDDRLLLALPLAAMMMSWTAIAEQASSWWRPIGTASLWITALLAVYCLLATPVGGHDDGAGLVESVA